MWKKLFMKGNTGGSASSSSSSGKSTDSAGAGARHRAIIAKASPARWNNLRGDLHSLLKKTEGPFRERLTLLESPEPEELIHALKDLQQMLYDAWHVPHAGREFAVSLLEIMGDEGYLHKILELLDASEAEEIQAEAAKLVEVSLSANNRSRIAKNGLIKLVKLADTRVNEDLGTCGIALLENMFKHSELTCDRIIQLGGLEVVLYACRSDVDTIQKHCAKALANCAMYGGRKVQKYMVKLNAHHWLFTLGLSKEIMTCYYASLATALLAVNREIGDEVESSGALKLVEKFVTENDPDEFAAASENLIIHGRSRDWIERLIPLLLSQKKGAQALGAFHLAMEASIKLQKDRVHDFYEIGIICPLKRVASSVDNDLAANLAIRALETIREEIPPKLKLDVYKWSILHVRTWLQLIGFENFANTFCKENQVDGELLLTITEKELEKDLGMTNGVLRKRFIRELMYLKEIADYTQCDPDNIADELRKVGPEYTQYSFNLVNAGISLQLIATLSPEQLNTILREDCAIENGVHRINIVEKFTSADYTSKKMLDEQSGIDVESPSADAVPKPLDVFISYRRTNGVQLASLLKVHLHLRGFKVFIDIEKVEGCTLDDAVLNQIRNAKSFVIVLTDGALDRCTSDLDNTDYVHKEIVAALTSSCNIVPVLHNFRWPPLDQLPEDMKRVCCFNGIKWIHDYQDACIDKLERFLRQPVKPRQLPSECQQPECSDAGSNGRPYSPEVHAGGSSSGSAGGACGGSCFI